MGYNLKILAEKSVDQTLYYNHECHMELRECIHDHVEDFRMVYDKEDFIKLSDHWIAARKKYDDLGQPFPVEEHSDLLSHAVLEGERLHHQRAALELTRGGADKDGGGDTIHFHYRHCRLHLTKCDFYRLANLFSEALTSYNKHYAEMVRLKKGNVVIRDVAREKYLPWLEDYSIGVYPKVNADDFWDIFLEAKNLLRPEEIQRPDGGFLKNVARTRNIPEEFDRRYLFTILECIKKYGYGEGPFKYNYIRAFYTVDGFVELTGSHRAACLVHLGYDEIPVILTNILNK